LQSVPEYTQIAQALFADSELWMLLVEMKEIRIVHELSKRCYQYLAPAQPQCAGEVKTYACVDIIFTYGLLPIYLPIGGTDE
jgi:hypothetical protein